MATSMLKMLEACLDDENCENKGEVPTPTLPKKRRTYKEYLGSTLKMGSMSGIPYRTHHRWLKGERSDTIPQPCEDNDHDSGSSSKDTDSDTDSDTNSSSVCEVASDYQSIDSCSSVCTESGSAQLAKTSKQKGGNSNTHVCPETEECPETDMTVEIPITCEVGKLQPFNEDVWYGEVLEDKLNITVGAEECVLNLAVPEHEEEDQLIQNQPPNQDQEGNYEVPHAGLNDERERMHPVPEDVEVQLEGILLDQPLYEGAAITLKQALVSIMAHQLSEGCTSSSISGLLQLLDLLLPRDSLLPTTKYLFEKVFSQSVGKHVFKFYCPDCESLLEVQNNTDVLCPSCQITYQKKKLLEQGNFFIYMPIRPQLTRLLQRPEIANSLSYRFNRQKETGTSIEDIYDGRCYQSLADGVLLNEMMADENISLTISTDGLPLFHSSNYSIWPLQAIVNELPPKLRKENTLIFGIWFGPQKPSINVYLEPFVEEMEALKRDGFVWLKDGNVTTTKVHTCICACDSVARCLLQNIKQFNGEFGCSWCLHPGEQMEKGNGTVRSYVYREQYVNEDLIRTDGGIREDAALACRIDEPVNGVKGSSVLMLLPNFDMVSGFVVDNLHCLDLGVSRQLTNMWLDSSNNNEAYYIGTSINEIDARLSLIHPPSEVTRLPRSIIKRKYWKGAEWHHWLLQYSIPVLHGILPNENLRHLMLLVEGIHLLSKDIIEIYDIQRADTCLHRFVSDFGDLYGEQNVTYNVHQLLHVADTVINWGPLWCYSTYVFEGNMQVILKMFNGTQAVPLQISNRFNLWASLVTVADAFVESDETSAKLKSFLKTTVLGCSLLKRVNRIDDMVFVGVSNRYVLDVEEVFLVQQLLNTAVLADAVAYKKVICNGMMIGSKRSHLTRSHRNDYTVITKGGECLQIELFVCVRTAEGRSRTMAVCRQVLFGDFLFRPDRSIGQCCSHICKFELGEKKVCHIDSIFSKCSVIEFPESVCCIHPRCHMTT